MASRTSSKSRAAALSLLDGLHTALPQLAPQIAEARARAQLRVGPFAEANAGPEAVFRWLSAPEKIGIDAFVARIPFDETRNYVERVLGNVARYQYLSGGAPAVSALNLDLPRASTRPDDVF